MPTGDASGTEPSTILNSNEDLLVVVNTYEVEPDLANQLIEVLTLATRDVLRHVPGFVSANLHLSADGSKVINYAQWRSRDALLAARDFPEVAERIRTAGQLATRFEPVQYTLRVIIAAG